MPVRRTAYDYGPNCVKRMRSLADVSDVTTTAPPEFPCAREARWWSRKGGEGEEPRAQAGGTRYASPRSLGLKGPSPSLQPLLHVEG